MYRTLSVHKHVFNGKEKQTKQTTVDISGESNSSSRRASAGPQAVLQKEALSSQEGTAAWCPYP